MNLRLSSKQIQTFAVLFCMIVMNISLSARADNSPLLIKDLGEGHCLVRVNTNQKYLLLPVEDASPDVRISMIVNNKEVKNFYVRLAGACQPFAGQHCLLQGNEIVRHVRHKQS